MKNITVVHGVRRTYSEACSVKASLDAFCVSTLAGHVISNCFET